MKAFVLVVMFLTAAFFVVLMVAAVNSWGQEHHHKAGEPPKGGWPTTKAQFLGCCNQNDCIPQAVEKLGPGRIRVGNKVFALKDELIIQMTNLTAQPHLCTFGGAAPVNRGNGTTNIICAFYRPSLF